MSIKVNFLQGTAYNAVDLVNEFNSLFSNGVISGGLVEANGTPNMTVNVAAATAIVNGMYFNSDATVSVPITANTSGYNRIDVIYLDCDNSLIGALAGTPSSSPTAPILTDAKIALAQVAVGNNVSVINNGNITDVRVLPNLTFAYSNNINDSVVKRDANGIIGVSHVSVKDYTSLSQVNVYIEGGGIRTWDGVTTKYYVAQGDTFMAGSTYPQVYGDGTNLHMSYDNDSSHGLVIDGAGNAVRLAGSGSHLGTSNHKWGDVYAVNGTIITSDRNEKNSIASLDSELINRFIMSLKPSSYKRNDGTSDRTHFGLISQEVEEAMTSVGLTDKDFAGFIKSPKMINDEVVENEFTYGLRYEEFIAPMLKVIQEQEKRIAILEEKLQAISI